MSTASSVSVLKNILMVKIKQILKEIVHVTNLSHLLIISLVPAPLPRQREYAGTQKVYCRTHVPVIKVGDCNNSGFVATPVQNIKPNC